MSCKRIEIDLGAVGSERLELPEGTVMDIQHVMRSKSSTVYAYEVGVQLLLVFGTLPVLEYQLISEENNSIQAEDGSEAVVTVRTDIRRSNRAASAQTITATINLLEKRKAFSVEVSRFRTLLNLYLYRPTSIELQRRPRPRVPRPSGGRQRHAASRPRRHCPAGRREHSAN